MRECWSAAYFGLSGGRGCSDRRAWLPCRQLSLGTARAITTVMIIVLLVVVITVTVARFGLQV